MVLRGHSDEVYSAAFAPDGRRIVTASRDKTARVWDAATGACLMVLEGHEWDVSTAAFSPDGRRIVTADKTARVWDAATGGVLSTSRAYADGWDTRFADGRILYRGKVPFLEVRGFETRLPKTMIRAG
jgi:WD40 repeat protein